MSYAINNPPTHTAKYNRAEYITMQSGIKFYTEKVFAIPYPVSTWYFSYYKLLYWTGSHTLSQIVAGTITRDSEAFRVVFHNGLTRGYILANPDEQYALSFRIPENEWELYPTVLISSLVKK